MDRAKPITFFSLLIPPILSGHKSVTRRVIKPQPYLDNDGTPLRRAKGKETTPQILRISDCRYQPGDVLYVKESVWIDKEAIPVVGCLRAFALDGTVRFEDGRPVVPSVHSGSDGDWTPDRLKELYKLNSLFKFRTSRFMPAWAARIFLHVKSVRVERLQDISEEDAIAEGVDSEHNDPAYPHDFSLCSECGGMYIRGGLDEVTLGYIEMDCSRCSTAKGMFENLWNKINGKKYPWDSNPYLWVIEFELANK